MASAGGVALRGFGSGRHIARGNGAEVAAEVNNHLSCRSCSLICIGSSDHGIFASP